MDNKRQGMLFGKSHMTFESWYLNFSRRKIIVKVETGLADSHTLGRNAERKEGFEFLARFFPLSGAVGMDS